MQEQMTSYDLTEEERNALNGIRGGLQGRMDCAFSMAYNALDVFDSDLRSNINPALYRKFLPYLHEINESLFSLERLSAQGTALVMNAVRDNVKSEFVGLLPALKMIVQCANEELGLYHRENSISVIAEDETELKEQWVNWEPFLHMMTNLFSNSLQAAENAKITLKCMDQCHLLYQDDGPGLPQAIRKRLEEETLEEEFLQNGKIGMLLVQQYAASMHWKMEIQDGEGVSLLFTMPEPTKQSPCFVMQSGSVQEEITKRECSHIIHRELQATIGSPKRRM